MYEASINFQVLQKRPSSPKLGILLFLITYVSFSCSSSLVECLLTVTRRQDDSFTVEEDKYLLEQLRKYGSDWNRIVEEFPSKSRRTVMKRYVRFVLKKR